MNGVRENIWNTKRKGGWARYNEETKNNKELDKVQYIEDNDIEAEAKGIERELDKVKAKVFGKVSVNKKPRVESKIVIDRKETKYWQRPQLG